MHADKRIVFNNLNIKEEVEKRLKKESLIHRNKTAMIGQGSDIHSTTMNISDKTNSKEFRTYKH